MVSDIVFLGNENDWTLVSFKASFKFHFYFKELNQQFN